MSLPLLIIDLSKTIESKPNLIEKQADLDIEALAIRPIEKAGKLLLTGFWQTDNSKDIDIDIEISTSLTSVCDRCLADTRIIIHTNLSSTLSAQDYQEKGYKIDITDLIYEKLLSCIPSRVLCRQDCKGLCPQCGINKNHNGCDCESKIKAPRCYYSQKQLEDKLEN